MPASSVPTSDIPPYQPVVQVIGACTGSDIAGYITACDSTTSTMTTCNTWFTTASASCASCLAGPATDAGVPTSQGGIWVYSDTNIGPNYPGCVDAKGMSACASAYEQVYDCIFAAGCLACTDNTSFTTCADTTVGTGGACAGYYTTYASACAPDFVDGGLLNGGVCTTDAEALSVICGNGSGDGG